MLHSPIMDRKLKQYITLQLAHCVEEIIETMSKGGKRTAWVEIEEKRMKNVAEEAIRLYKESIQK